MWSKCISRDEERPDWRRGVRGVFAADGFPTHVCVGCVLARQRDLCHGGVVQMWEPSHRRGRDTSRRRRALDTSA